MLTGRSTVLVFSLLIVSVWLAPPVAAVTRSEQPPAAEPPAVAAARLPASPTTPAPGDELLLTPELAAAGITQAELNGPYEPAVDANHPDGQVTPALGGRVIMHVSAEPPNLNFLIENTGSIRWIHHEIHAGLLQFDPASWEMELDLAVHYDIEDTLVLKPGHAQVGADGERLGEIAFGKIVDETADTYVLESGSKWHQLARTSVPKSEVERVERGTVYTFTLREGVRWHDGHPLDEQDVLFSMGLFNNPHVDCDEKRYKYVEINRSERVADGVVRFFWNEQYFGSTDAFGLDFCVLPSHLYNLADPDNKDFDPDAGAERQGSYVNENSHNIDWVGLGAYKVKRFEPGQFIEATRFEQYWERAPERAGYLDTLRWSFIKSDDGAFAALLNGEIDIFSRVKSEDFFGEATRTELFTSQYYKTLVYLGNVGYTVWNLYQPKLADVRVRTALAHAFDVPKWIETNYRGYSLWATGTQFWFGPAYNHAVSGIEYDPELAEDLLADAGWYDRDGDGIIDKDGQNMVLEFLMPSGNKASEKFLQALQDSYRSIGVKLDIQQYEWATFLEHIRNRDFDAANLAWILSSPESDPQQIWHGDEGAFDKRSSNNSGLQDEQVDALIDAGRRELDPEKRHAIWYDLHARIHELQPYMFGWNVPRKLAISKRIHGVKLYKFSPGFRLRDMYFAEGTPGTRPLSN